MKVLTPTQGMWYSGWRDGYMGQKRRLWNKNYSAGFRAGMQERAAEGLLAGLPKVPSFAETEVH